MVRTKDSALSKEQLGAMGNKMIKGGVARGAGKGEGGKGGKGKMYKEGYVYHSVLEGLVLRL
jgi:Na+/alanine symporter